MNKIFLRVLIVLSFTILSLCSRKRAVHILDPNNADFVRYESWNSDQWIKWLRERYEDDAKERRTNDTIVNNSPPLYGIWSNIIVVSSQEDIESAFTQNSKPSYTSVERKDYFWSDVPFPVFVIIRGPKGNETSFNVYNCCDRKMFINAKLNMETFNPIELKTFFPRKVKNPGDKLRVPLVECKKVLQVRSLQDEIDFLFRAAKTQTNSETSE